MQAYKNTKGKTTVNNPEMERERKNTVTEISYILQQEVSKSFLGSSSFIFARPKFNTWMRFPFAGFWVISIKSRKPCKFCLEKFLCQLRMNFSVFNLPGLLVVNHNLSSKPSVHVICQSSFILFFRKKASIFDIWCTIWNVHALLLIDSHLEI